jgi:hypothetical protein
MKHGDNLCSAVGTLSETSYGGRNVTSTTPHTSTPWCLVMDRDNLTSSVGRAVFHLPSLQHAVDVGVRDKAVA